MISGMLGVGGGVVMVPAMNLLMRVPVKAAVGTSTFMVGMTSVATAFVFYSRGFIDPTLVVPAIVGVFLGGQIGSRLTRRIKAQRLALLFARHPPLSRVIASAASLRDRDAGAVMSDDHLTDETDGRARRGAGYGRASGAHRAAGTALRRGGEDVVLGLSPWGGASGTGYRRRAGQARAARA